MPKGLEGTKAQRLVRSALRYRYITHYCQTKTARGGRAVCSWTRGPRL